MHEPHLAAVCIAFAVGSLILTVAAVACFGFSAMMYLDKDPESEGVSSAAGKIGAALMALALLASHLSGYFNPW